LLTICPRDLKNAGALFDAAIQRRIRVLVSAHEMDEARTRCNNFWKKKPLSKMPLKDGWQITKTAKSILAVGKKERDGTRAPRIIETTLLATKGNEKRILTHLHYDAWRDGYTMPDEKLMHVLHDRMQELNPSNTVPISVNCRAGVGRTGTIVVSHHMRKEIERQVAAGKNLDDIRINIPATHFAFRTQRPRLLGRAEQLAQVYSILGDYYARLKQK
jgi:protein tyrosine phosphatase